MAKRKPMVIKHMHVVNPPNPRTKKSIFRSILHAIKKTFTMQHKSKNGIENTAAKKAREGMMITMNGQEPVNYLSDTKESVFEIIGDEDSEIIDE